MFLILRLVFVVLLGFTFGFIVEKTRIHEPIQMRRQLLIKSSAVLKFYCSSLAGGMFVISLATFIPKFARAFHTVSGNFFRSLRIQGSGILTSMFGGFIMGFGISLSGACSNTVFVQIGAMVPNSLYLFAGSIIGTVLFCLFNKRLDILRSIYTSSSHPYTKGNYASICLPLAVMFGMLFIAFDILSPWHLELKHYKPKNEAAKNVFSMRAWAPYIGSIFIGVSQVFHIIIIKDLMCGSGALITLVSQFLGRRPLNRFFPSCVNFLYGFTVWWQVIFVFSTATGAYYSSMLSSAQTTVRGVSPMEAFFGGLLLYFGALVACGCTTAHGISGLTLMSILSFITIITTFVTAVIFSRIIYIYKNYVIIDMLLKSGGTFTDVYKYFLTYL